MKKRKAAKLIVYAGMLSALIIFLYLSQSLPVHFRSREAFAAWTIPQLESPEGFREAQKDETDAGGVRYAIFSHSYIALGNGEKIYFITHSSHDGHSTMLYDNFGDYSLLKCGDRIYFSDEHVCGCLDAIDVEEYYSDLDDFLNSDGQEWKPY